MEGAITIPDNAREVDSLWVGAATVEVAVPPGTYMAGFAARDEPSAGVHDALTVRSLVIEDFCWITVDVCGLDAATCRAIGNMTRFAEGHVVVSATHTHSGPCVIPGSLGGCDTGVLAAITAAAVKAAVNASDTRERCSAHYDAFSNLGIARNRRHPELNIDPALQVVVFKRRDEAVHAWLVQYPCHPVVLGADNRLISGDYPAFVRGYLERQSPGSTAVFLTGAAGDVNTGHSAESSYSKASAERRTFEEAERIGTLLGAAAVEARKSALPIGHDHSVAAGAVELELESLDAHTPDDLAARWAKLLGDASNGEKALLRAWIDWAAQHRSSMDVRWEGSVTVMRLGSLLVVALPGEPFLGCAEQIQNEFGTPVIVAAYSNGCPGYFPTAEEYDRGGYEVTDAHRYYGMPAPFKRGSAEMLVDTAIQLGRRLM